MWPDSDRWRSPACATWRRAASDRCSRVTGPRSRPCAAASRSRVTTGRRSCAAPVVAASPPRSVRCSCRRGRERLVLLAGLVLGRLVHETALGSFVADAALVPVTAITYGPAGALAGACVVLPMLVKRAARQRAPVGSQHAYVRAPSPLRQRPGRAMSGMNGPREPAGFTALLRRRAFRTLLVGQTISSLGDWMGTVALMALVLDQSGSSTAVGGILALRLLPGAIGGPLAARAASRWDRRRTMVTMDLAAAGMIALVPLVGQLWWIYIWAFSLEVGEPRVPPCARCVDPRPRRRRGPAARQRARARLVVRDHPAGRGVVRARRRVAGRRAARTRLRAGLLRRRRVVPRGRPRSSPA